jgi:hypothetical protein
MLACEGLRGLALGSIAFSLAIGHLHYEQVTAVAFVEATFSILFLVAERAALRQVVSQEQLDDAVAQNLARLRRIPRRAANWRLPVRFGTSDSVPP